MEGLGGRACGRSEQHRAHCTPGRAWPSYPLPRITRTPNTGGAHHPNMHVRPGRWTGGATAPPSGTWTTGEASRARGSSCCAARGPCQSCAGSGASNGCPGRWSAGAAMPVTRGQWRRVPLPGRVQGLCRAPPPLALHRTARARRRRVHREGDAFVRMGNTGQCRLLLGQRLGGPVERGQDLLKKGLECKGQGG